MISILSIIKDEQLYLQEWLGYHFSIGVDRIILYEDTNSSPHQVYDPRVSISPIPINGEDRQRKLLIQEAAKLTGWVAFIDIDEFIRVAPGKTLEEALISPGIGMTRINIGWSGNLKYDPRPVQERFKIPGKLGTSQKFYNEKIFLKCPGNLTGVHTAPGIIRSNDIWIDHYYTKSWEEWGWRFSKRGDLYPGTKGIQEFFEVNPDAINKIKL